MSRHPGARELDAYADGRLGVAARSRVAEHIAACAACRREAEELRGLGELARSAPVPAVPAGALDRVLARRAAGERFILPAADGQTDAERGYEIGRRVGRWVGMAASVVAVAGLALAATRAPAWVASFRARAAAREAAAAPPPGTLVHAPPARLDASRMKPAVLRYRTSTITDSVHTSVVAESEVEIARAQHEGRDAWVIRSRLLSSFVPSRRELPADVLYLDPADLSVLEETITFTTGDVPGGVIKATTVTSERQRRHLERNIAAARERRLRAQGDSAVAREAAAPRRPVPMAQGRLKSFRLTMELGRWVGVSSLDIGAGLLPLRRGWSGRVPLTWTGLPVWLGPVVPPREVGVEGTTLRVVGEARVRVPAGTFDCWTVEVSSGPRIYPRQTFERHTLWVAKDGGWVVKRVETVSYASGGTTDFVRELTQLATPK